MKLKLLLGIALITVTTFFCISTIAAESEESESQTQAEQSEDASDEEESKPQVTPSGEVFIPTEEISEDFAVSFPVDI